MTDHDVDAIAAALRADAAESAVLLDVVATKLADALPALTEVTRRGLFGRGRKHVHSLQVTLGDRRFTLKRERHGVAATVTHVVHGITLSTEQVEPDRWLHELAQGLAHLAATQMRARQALDRLIFDRRSG